MKKIVLIGPESTGKTTLSMLLAERYGEPWVPEFAREYLTGLNRKYTKEDLLEIAKGQIRIEEKEAEKAGKFLFCDTDLIVVKLWSEHVFEICDAWITEQIEQREYHHYFLCKNDFPWESDPLRENPQQGDFFFKKFESVLKDLDKPYTVLTGDVSSRWMQAKEILDGLSE